MVGNTHEIQNGRNPVRDWFIPVATKVKPDIANGNTSQGKYVVAADGTAYGFNNNRSVERVLQLMDRSLAQFRSNPPRTIEIPETLMNASFAPEPPKGSMILRSYTRIKPAPLGCDSANENVALDHFWVLPEELSELANGRMPDSLRLRFFRFALVDNVRGEPDHWRLNEIKIGDFVNKAPGKWEGQFSLVTANGLRGYEGLLTLQVSKNEIKGYADGQAWGQSTYTPNPPPGKFPLKVALITWKGQTIAPQAALFGREYLTGK